MRICKTEAFTQLGAPSRTSNAVIKMIIDKINEYYNDFYDHPNKYHFDIPALAKIGDKILQNCKPLVAALVEVRHDYFSSDRDCAALAKALLYFNLVR